MKPVIARSADHHARTRHPAGFTLLEMLLVLAVLITALALVYPSVNRMFQDQRLLRAVEQVQGRLSAARVRAVDHQVNYQFRFEPNGRRFVVFPEPESLDSVNEDESAEAAARYRFSGELPATLQFAPEGWTENAAPVPESYLQGLANPSELAGVSWSQPLLFHPDSTSTGGTIAVFDERGFEVRFDIRPVTGGVTVSPIERRQTGP